MQVFTVKMEIYLLLGKTTKSKWGFKPPYLTISIQYCSLCCPVECVNALVHLISVGLCINVG